MVIKIISRICRIIDKIILMLFKLFPIKRNYIILESEGDYTDNVKVFYDYLLQKKYNKSLKLIWIVHDPKEYPKIENVIFVSRFSRYLNIKAMYYIAVSKYFIFSHPYWLNKWRKQQIVIYTTHSVAQLKGKGSPIKYKLADYILCCSEYCKEQTAFVLNVDKKIVIPIGMPRIDLMYQKKECLPQLIKGYNNEQIILCMETFKQAKGWSDSSFINKYGINIINSKEELFKLNDYLLSNNIILIVKLHHLQDTSYFKDLKLSNIIYLYDSDLKELGLQTNDLLVNADILLTDYSSVFYEFLLTDKQIGFLIGDFENYERGFLMEDPLSEMPGEKIINLEQLINFINDANSNVDRFAEERKKIKEKVFKFDDCHNCERLYDWMMSIEKE